MFPELKTRYIDTGKARYMLPLDNLAATAFMLARCSGDDCYYPMVDAMFATQENRAVPGVDAKDKLLQIARPTILLFFAVGVALGGCGGGAVTADATADKALNVPAPEELMADGPLGERVLGSPNAPVTVIEYASLTCPHTAHFQKDVFPRVKKELIDTGKIRFIVREFPIGHTSGAAAIINRCAPEDIYFSLFNAFLLRQPEWVSQEVRPDAIYSVAKSSGMSRETFDKCLTNQTIIDGLTEVKQRGRKFGVVGTPTFFANGRKAQGNITFEEFKALLGPQSST